MRSSAGQPLATHRLSLLGSWRLTHRGRELTASVACQRLIALLALKDGHPRSRIAEILWPASSEQQARANLRAALFRLRQTDQAILLSHRGLVALSPTVTVDAHDLARHAAEVSRECNDAELSAAQNILLTTGDLLPGWYDDWVHAERERLRQLRLHALEALAERLSWMGRHAQALEAALAAAEIDPFREGAHRAAIRSYLAEGNVAEAVRRFEWFDRLVRHELACAPSRHLLDLVRPFLRSRDRRATDDEDGRAGQPRISSAVSGGRIGPRRRSTQPSLRRSRRRR